MKTRNLEEITFDLLSLPPLINKALQRNLTEVRPFGTARPGLSYHHYEILRLIAQKEPMQATQIGKSLHIAKAHMTKLIDRLVALHLVERINDSEDRRSYNISLTSEAKIVEKQRQRYLKRAIRELMSGLTGEQVESLSNAIGVLRNFLLKNTDDNRHHFQSGSIKGTLKTKIK